MKLFNFSNIHKEALHFLRKIYFRAKIKFFVFFRKKKEGKEVRAKNDIQNGDLDKKLVRSLSKSRIPSFRQIKYARKILSKRELFLLRLSFVVLLISSISWAAIFYFSHLQTVPVRGGVYKEAMLGAPKYINPLYSSISDVDSDLANLVFSSLYKRGKDGELKADLVTEVSVDKDARIYSFKIKNNVLWHDDKNLSATDIAFTFAAIKDLQYDSTLKESFEGVDIEVLSDYELRFILSEPYAAFLDLLTFGIMPAHLWSQIPPDSARLAELNLKPIGSGPYVFDSLAKDKSGAIKEFSLIVNELYYDRQPLVDLKFYFYGLIEEAVDALNNQVVDGISYLPFDQKEMILTPNSYSFEKLQLPQLTLVFFNQKNNSSLQDKAVRQALSYAIDRNEIANTVFEGNAYLVDGPILNNNFAYFPDIKKYDYRVEEAEKLLDGVDWNLAEVSLEDAQKASEETDDENEKAKNANILEVGEGRWRTKDGRYLVINLKTVDRGVNVEVVEKIREYWEAIGVKVIVEVVDLLNAQNEVIRPRNFEAFYFGQILGSDPDPYVFWHSSQADETGYNIANFTSKEVDALLEDARQSSDQQLRQEKYKRFQEIISEEQPAIFMHSPVYIYIHFNKLKGFEVNNILLPRDRFSNIDEWYIKEGRRFILE